MRPSDLPLRYFDNPATSWPKAPGVGSSMVEALEVPGSASRSAHATALQASKMLGTTRKQVARFFGVSQPNNIIFTAGATSALNLVLDGHLSPDRVSNEDERRRVLISVSEHNAVTRPLGALQGSRGNIDITWIDVDEHGIIDLDHLEQELYRGDVVSVVCQHGSNVTGAIQPINEVVRTAHAYGAYAIVDGAQVGGHLPIDLASLGADAWVCSGHKGLLGPKGVGVLYLDPQFSPRPLTLGGTGSGGYFVDESLPPARPSDYEVGTEPLPAIWGLGAAIKHLEEHQEEYREYEQEMGALLYQALSAIPRTKILGPSQGELRLPLASVVIEGHNHDDVAFTLDRQFNIASRAGLHCAPALYDFFGLGDRGALRFGVGPHTLPTDIEFLADALRQIVQ